jgi:hypothetical protein
MFINGVRFATIVTLLFLTVSVGFFAYIQSFTGSTFGGWIGFLIPILGTLTAFVLGFIFSDSEEEGEEE